MSTQNYAQNTSINRKERIFSGRDTYSSVNASSSKKGNRGFNNTNHNNNHSREKSQDRSYQFHFQQSFQQQEKQNYKQVRMQQDMIAEVNEKNYQIQEKTRNQDKVISMLQQNIEKLQYQLKQNNKGNYNSVASQFQQINEIKIELQYQKQINYLQNEISNLTNEIYQYKSELNISQQKLKNTRKQLEMKEEQYIDIQKIVNKLNQQINKYQQILQQDIIQQSTIKSIQNSHNSKQYNYSIINEIHDLSPKHSSQRQYTNQTPATNIETPVHKEQETKNDKIQLSSPTNQPKTPANVSAQAKAPVNVSAQAKAPVNVSANEEKEQQMKKISNKIKLVSKNQTLNTYYASEKTSERTSQPSHQQIPETRQRKTIQPLLKKNIK